MDQPRVQDVNEGTNELDRCSIQDGRPGPLQKRDEKSDGMKATGLS